MRQIFVNLKRFEVPKEKGGLCPQADPAAWIESVIDETVELGLGQQENLQLTYMLPEGLLFPAVSRLQTLPQERRARIAIGVQGVHWDDIRPGKNFGAFTASLPAAAAASLGARWAIIGHSEERKAKLQVLETFEPGIGSENELRARAARAVDRLIQAEVGCALDAGLQVLLCMGETAEERGDGQFEEQKPRIEAVLKAQLEAGLQDAGQALKEQRVVIGYEPVWAIGPGKTPPGEAYITFVSGFIKRTARELSGYEPAVVYGGGLKEENAAMIAGIESIDGGLVALTRFTGEIGFEVSGLKGIVEKYLA